jgi:putative membrane protein
MVDALIYFLISVLVLAVSLLIISKIPPVGVEIDSPVKALLGGAIIGAFNGIWGFEGFRLRWGIWSAIMGSLALAIVSSLLKMLLGAFGLAV